MGDPLRSVHKASLRDAAVHGGIAAAPVPDVLGWTRSGFRSAAEVYVAGQRSPSDGVA
jgi:hypothetical protein